MAGAVVAAATAAGCIPNPAVTCALSAGRTATQACIDGSPEVKLTGTATWTVTSGAGLVVGAGHVVVLAEDAQVNARYSVDNGQSTAISVEGGTFWMSDDSSVSNWKSTGTIDHYRTQEENRVGITVKDGGNVQMIGATVTAAGYAVIALGGANNTVALTSSIAWGSGGLVSVPTTGVTNTVSATESGLVGTLAPLIVEPNQATAPKTKVNIQGTSFLDRDGDDPMSTRSGWIGANPAIDPTGDLAVLASGSAIHDNTGTATMTVSGCQGAMVYSNQFGKQVRGC
jgi:hypothetical protein